MNHPRNGNFYHGHLVIFFSIDRKEKEIEREKAYFKFNPITFSSTLPPTKLTSLNKIEEFQDA